MPKYSCLKLDFRIARVTTESMANLIVNDELLFLDKINSINTEIP